MKAIGVFNTAVGSANVGDRIIMEACRDEIEMARPDDQYIDFSSHDTLMYHSLKVQRRRISWNILCGTNCLSSHMLLRPAWSVNLVTANLVRPVTTMGVGWGAYQGRPDAYTRTLLKRLLGHGGMLSVRDSYTQQKLWDCGVEAVNTGCATLWNLHKGHCESIPKAKAPEVIYTLTDYSPSPAHDVEALRLISLEYCKIHLWLQGAGDANYYRSLLPELRKFVAPGQIEVVPPNLRSFDSLLQTRDLDYVGTRLHGGIRAMQKGKRTLILAVDNRAVEMGRDFALPVVPRSELERLPALIRQERETSVHLPAQAIEAYRAFIRGWHV